MGIREELERIRTEALKGLASAEDEKSVEEIRVKVLGKKGELTAILKQMGSLPAEERPAAGREANMVRSEIEKALSDALDSVRKKMRDRRLAEETVDVRLRSDVDVPSSAETESSCCRKGWKSVAS